MSDADDRQQGEDRGPEPARPPENESAPRGGTITVSTLDPVVSSESEDQAEWRRHPDATTYTETTGTPEPGPVYLTGVRTVVLEPAARRRERGENGHGGRADRKDRGDEARARGDERSRTGTDEEHGRDADRDEGRDRAASKPAALGLGSYFLIGGIALLCGVLGAFGYSYFFGPSKSDEASSQKQASGQKSGQEKKSSAKSGGSEKGGSESGAESASAIPGFTSARDAETLRKQIDHLAERLDRLGQRVDELDQPRDQTPPDLHTLQNKVGKLAREVDDVADLPSKYRRLEDRLLTLQEQLKALRDRTSEKAPEREETRAVNEAVEDLSGGSNPVKVPSPPRTGEPGGPDDAAMSEAIDLFRRGRYAMAREILHKMQVPRADDARVWYYSALARGLTTGDWQGETRRLLDRGLECEQTGKTSTTLIEKALAGLEPSQRRWLDSYRGPLARRP